MAIVCSVYRSTLCLHLKKFLAPCLTPYGRYLHKLQLVLCEYMVIRLWKRAKASVGRIDEHCGVALSFPRDVLLMWKKNVFLPMASVRRMPVMSIYLAPAASRWNWVSATSCEWNANEIWTFCLQNLPLLLCEDKGEMGKTKDTIVWDKAI